MIKLKISFYFANGKYNYINQSIGARKRRIIINSFLYNEPSDHQDECSFSFLRKTLKLRTFRLPSSRKSLNKKRRSLTRIRQLSFLNRISKSRPSNRLYTPFKSRVLKAYAKTFKKHTRLMSAKNKAVFKDDKKFRVIPRNRHAHKRFKLTSFPKSNFFRIITNPFRFVFFKDFFFKRVVSSKRFAISDFRRPTRRGFKKTFRFLFKKFFKKSNPITLQKVLNKKGLIF